MSKSLLSEIYDPAEFRRRGHYLIDLLAKHLEESQNRKPPRMYPGISPSAMLEHWKGQEGGLGFEDLIKQTLDGSINLHHPHYIGHQVVPPAPMAVLAEMMGAFLNNGMAVYEMGPASTAMERLAIERLCGWLGLSVGCSGFLTSGGSLGNLTALLTARRIRVPEDRIAKAGILVSEQAHYSIARAATIMGIPASNVIKVQVDDKLSMDGGRLEADLQAARSRGIEPFVIVGSACTTSTGAYDPLRELATFAKENSLWFHIDGAHGAIAAMLPEYKCLVDGFELADSWVVDFHKMFLMPALTTAVLYRDERQSFSTFRQDAEYLLRADESDEWYNSGNRTVECTKLMMGFRVFAMMELYGKEAFIEYGNTTFGLARQFADIVSRHQSFEQGPAPQSNILCFRMKGKDDRCHTLVREALLREGEFYIVQTKIHGTTYFRTTVMNPFTTVDDFNLLLSRLIGISTSI